MSRRNNLQSQIDSDLYKGIESCVPFSPLFWSRFLRNQLKQMNIQLGGTHHAVVDPKNALLGGYIKSVKDIKLLQQSGHTFTASGLGQTLKDVARQCTGYPMVNDKPQPRGLCAATSSSLARVLFQKEIDAGFLRILSNQCGKVYGQIILNGVAKELFVKGVPEYLEPQFLGNAIELFQSCQVEVRHNEVVVTPRLLGGCKSRIPTTRKSLFNWMCVRCGLSFFCWIPFSQVLY